MSGEDLPLTGPRAGYLALTTGKGQQPPPLTFLAESLPQGRRCHGRRRAQPLAAPAALPAQGILRIP